MKGYKFIYVSWMLIVQTCFCLGQNLGDKLPAWQEGYLDIHHINTGCGECAYLIFPDGTTMLIDAGENNPDRERHVAPKPNASKTPGQWVVDYIRNMPPGGKPRLDYALATHFHNDHIGGVLKTRNASDKYYNTGIITVVESIPTGKLVDRGFPDYSFLVNTEDKMLKNYFDFLRHTRSGISVERFRPGSGDQFRLLYDTAGYADKFEVRNIYANGWLWTGKDTLTTYLFPDIGAIEKNDMPQENSLSCVLKITYGNFSYYTGGDVTGYPKPGRSPFHNVETPMSQIVGKTTVCCVNHHGYNNATNDDFLKALRPQIFIIQASDALHPNHSTLDRMLSKHIYKGERDVFATNLHPAAKVVIGDITDRMKSAQGHILVRVLPSGKQYYIYILEDKDAKRRIKAVHGPYNSNE